MAAETTSVASSARKIGRKSSSVALVANPLTGTYTTTDNQLNDVMEVGYIPAGVTCIGMTVATTDMDTGTAVVHKVTIGSTDVASSLTLAQTGASGFYAFAPITTTAPTLVKITTTTAATTAVAGSIVVTPIYFSGS
jgi:hypothetical protein